MKYLIHIICSLLLSLSFSYGEENTNDSTSLDGKPGVLQEVWFNIGGTDIVNLIKDESYLKPAKFARVVPQIDFNNLFSPLLFGVKYTTLIIPPATGNYQFYLASDDASELWLSNNDSDKDMSCIAFVRGFTYPKQWLHQASQISKPIQLEKGKAYLLTVLHKEGGAVNHLALAWTGPDIEKPTIIPASVFHLPKIPETKQKSLNEALAAPLPEAVKKQDAQ